MPARCGPGTFRPVPSRFPLAAGSHCWYRILREPVAFSLLTDGAYQPHVVRFMQRHLDPGSVYVDVGANVGALALPVARHIGPEGRVIAVEASPEVFACLDDNCRRSAATNVECIQAAACDVEGAVTFYPAPDHKFGMGSMAARFDARPAEVRACRLDDLVPTLGIGRVHLIKIDVEGFELRVLRGAERLLTGEHPPLVVFEFCDWAEASALGTSPGDAQQFLMERGFQIWRLAEFPRPEAVLRETLRTGFETLVARRPSRA